MKKGFLYFSISGALWILSGFVLNVGLGRVFGPELYGTYGTVVALLSIIFPLLGNGVRQAVTKYVASDPDLAGSILLIGLKTQLILSLTLGVMIFLFSRPISMLLHDLALVNFIRLSSILIPLYALFNIYMGFLEGAKEFRRLAIVSTTYSISRIGIIFVLVFYGLAIYGAITGMILSIFLGTVVGFFFCRGQSNDGHFEPIKLLQFAFPVFLFFVVVDFMAYIDVLLVKSILADDVKTGFYTSAKSISRFVYFVVIPFSIVLLPSISRSIGTGDLVHAKKYVSSSVRYLLMFLLPLISMLSTTSDKLIALVYGNNYIPAARPLSILIVGMCFWSITSVLSTIMQGYGKPGIPSRIFAILIPLDIGLHLILIPRFDLMGAAIATAATFLLGLVMSGVVMFWQFRGILSIKSCLKIIFAAGVVALIAPHVAVSGPLLPACYLALFAIYSIILLALNEINSDDKYFLRKALRELPISYGFRNKKGN